MLLFDDGRSCCCEGPPLSLRTLSPHARQPGSFVKTPQHQHVSDHLRHLLEQACSRAALPTGRALLFVFLLLLIFLLLQDRGIPLLILDRLSTGTAGAFSGLLPIKGVPC